MLGRVVYFQSRGGGAPGVERVAGLTLAQGTLWDEAGRGGWRARRQLRALRRFFLRQGVGRVILPEGFPYGEALAGFGRVDELPFYRAVADLLALGGLAALGVPRERAVAALSAPRLCPELTAAAERLCPQVRGLLIDVPGEGVAYAAWLHRQYGLPVGPPERADVTVAFGPGGGRWGWPVELYQGAPPPALEVTAPDLRLPGDCAGQLLAALWERGGLDRTALRVARRKPS